MCEVQMLVVGFPPPACQGFPSNPRNLVGFHWELEQLFHFIGRCPRAVSEGILHRGSGYPPTIPANSSGSHKSHI